MFALVKFGCNHFKIYRSKQIVSRGENPASVIIKDRGGRYDAELLASHDNVDFLHKMEENLRERVGNICTKEDVSPANDNNVVEPSISNNNEENIDGGLLAHTAVSIKCNSGQDMKKEHTNRLETSIFDCAMTEQSKGYELKESHSSVLLSSLVPNSDSDNDTIWTEHNIVPADIFVVIKGNSAQDMLEKNSYIPRPAITIFDSDTTKKSKRYEPNKEPPVLPNSSLPHSDSDGDNNWSEQNIMTEGNSEQDMPEENSSISRTAVVPFDYDMTKEIKGIEPKDNYSSALPNSLVQYSDSDDDSNRNEQNIMTVPTSVPIVVNSEHDMREGNSIIPRTVVTLFDSDKTKQNNGVEPKDNYSSALPNSLVQYSDSDDDSNWSEQNIMAVSSSIPIVGNSEHDTREGNSVIPTTTVTLFDFDKTKQNKGIEPRDNYFSAIPNSLVQYPDSDDDSNWNEQNIMAVSSSIPIVGNSEQDTREGNSVIPRTAVTLFDSDKTKQNKGIEPKDNYSSALPNSLVQYSDSDDDSNWREQNIMADNDFIYQMKGKFHSHIKKVFNNAAIKGDQSFTRTENVSEPSLPMNCEEAADEFLGTDVSVQPKRKKSAKKHCCLYCGNFFEKIARHLASVHSSEPDVIKFNSLPPKSPLRLTLIDKLRKSGNFKYNKTLASSDSQVLPIVCRRAQKYKERPPCQFIPCPKCKGYYSKFSLRNHIKNCMPGDKSMGRNLQAVSRSYMAHNIHPLASEILKKCVLNRLNVDSVGSLVRSDELIVIYGNRLCRKYRRQQYQNYQMIRSKLRTIGRFFIAFRELSPATTCLKDALTLENVENIIKAVENVANLNEEGTKFQSSSTGYALTNQIKYITTLLAGEYTKKNDKHMADLTFSLSKLLEVEFSESINATVKETQHEIKRQKNLTLPNTKQIQQFHEFLKKKIIHYYALLETSFSVDNWRQLASYTLVSIQVFNRKRTGEAQNMTIQDFKSYKYVDKNTDKAIFDSLTDEEKKLVKKYIQVSIRSKRGLRAEGTPILLNSLHFNSLKIILKHRHAAGVPEENCFVFGIPGQDTYMTLNACELLRKFAQESGVSNCHLLRGNHLRKHIATSVSMKGYDSVTKDRLSDFMAHSKIVHKNFYELPHQVTNITKISKLLEEASGGDDQSEEIIEDVEFEDMHGSMSNAKKECLQEMSVHPQNSTKANSRELNSGQCTPPNCSSPLQKNKSDYSTAAKRKSWQTPEKAVVRKYFKNSLLTGQMPSTKECKKLIEKTPVLRYRSPTQILTWLRHQHSLLSRTSFRKKTWSTPEKHLVRQSFAEYFMRQKMPSITECDKLKEENPDILKDRTPQMIKAFFACEVRRRLWQNDSIQDNTNQSESD